MNDSRTDSGPIVLFSFPLLLLLPLFPPLPALQPCTLCPLQAKCEIAAFIHVWPAPALRECWREGAFLPHRWRRRTIGMTHKDNYIISYSVWGPQVPSCKYSEWCHQCRCVAWIYSAPSQLLIFTGVVNAVRDRAENPWEIANGQHLALCSLCSPTACSG